MSARTAIRNAVTARLKGATDAGDNVFASRVKPLFDQQMPALLVYTRDEKVVKGRYDGDGSMEIWRELELCVEAVCLGSDGLDDALDGIAEQVEASLNDYELPERKADTIRLKSTESDIAVNGDKTYGAIRLTFTITYKTKGKDHAENQDATDGGEP